MEWYYAARYFHMHPDVWDRLAWHKQRALLEGLIEERDSDGEGDTDANSSNFADLTDADDRDLAGTQFSVETA